MRTKKALINSSVNMISFIIAFIPNLIIRKVFLDSLGSEILGLNSLYTNILGWLSIMEMGVGTAIVFSLYKPYVENDRNKIRAYIRFYGKFYRKIGIIILTLGICITPFLKYFIKEEIDLVTVNIGFILFLFNSVITYMFSNRLCILNVAQEEYKITISSTISKLIIAFLQILLLKSYPSFILFIVLQIIINIIYYILINFYITNKYPWINENKGFLLETERKNLLKNVKAMFMHKIAGLVVDSTDNIIISSFVGLSSLSNYANYQMVITALKTMVNSALNGVTSSIGNMLAYGNKSKAYNVHKRIFFLNFWIVSFIVISLYNTLNQFIGIWIGEKYILDKFTFIVILINMYFSLMRGAVEQFQSASGNFYQDRYAAFMEAIINLVFSLILVKKFGMMGVFIGTLISNFTVIFWTKPYVVYKYVFNVRLSEYFKMYFKYLLLLIIPLVITNYITVLIKSQNSLSAFILNCIINILVINGIYVLIFFKTTEFKYYLGLIKGIIKRG